ncbi:MAG: Thiol-disulfide oxidoreductase ResA [Verrucomicrobiota bacterium]|jgi:hypothetical protein
MNNEPPVSKVVVVFCLVVVLLCAWLGWRAWRPHQISPAPVVAKVTAKPTPAPEVVAAPELAAPRPASELPPVIPVSLVPYLLPEESNLGQLDDALKSLPTGTQVYGGIEFWLQGALSMQGLASRDEQKILHRESVLIPLTAATGAGKLGCLHLLGGTRFSSPTPGEKFADVVWHYADGSAQRSAIGYDTDLRDWSRKRYEQPVRLPNPLTKVAWHAEHPTRKDRSLRFYRLTVPNPQPQKPVAQIEFASAMTRPSLLVLALTLDPARAGERADDLTGDEMPDPELKGLVKIFVQSPDGYAVTGAKLRVTAQDKLSQIQPLVQSFTTGEDGSADVKFPTDELATLEVSAAHDDYGARRMRWDLKAGDTVPQTFVLKLGEGLTLGGQVVNPADAPIAGARVDIYRSYTSSEEMNKKGVQPDYSPRSRQAPLMTGADGRWQAKGVPVELKSSLGFQVTHKDYLSESIHLDGSSSELEKLRAGTYKTILKTGLTLSGRVLGDVNQPIPNATVSLGQQYSSDRSTAKTDAAGQFTLTKVDVGEQPLAVTAKGYAPDSRNVQVTDPPSELVIKLGGAHFLRALVQDEQGSPLAGVRASLGWNNGQALQFSATTDAQGRFSWDSAPAWPVKFDFSKEGYLYSNDKLLNPDTENVVVLKKSAKVHGYVVDATTGQPVTKFRVGLGKSYNEGKDFYFNNSNSGEEKADVNGQFTLELQSEDSNAIRAGADDYADETQMLPAAQNGEIQVTLRLKASPALRGTVTLPDGTPLPGMNVAAAPAEMGGNSLSVRNGKINGNSGSRVATTDEQGKFALSSPPEDGTVVASGDAGFGTTTIAQLRATGVVVVQGFGRIEGVLRVGGQPLAGEIIRYSSDLKNVYYDSGSGMGAKTDEQGKFTLEKIPAGTGSLVRLVQSSANSWTHSHKISVTVEAGKTTQVTLGESGAVVRGTVRFEVQPEDISALRINGSVLGSGDNGGYHFNVKPDGTFSVDSVPPGEHHISVEVTRRRPGGRDYESDTVATGSTAVTVPNGANSYQAINAGEILLRVSGGNGRP